MTCALVLLVVASLVLVPGTVDAQRRPGGGGGGHKGGEGPGHRPPDADAEKAALQSITVDGVQYPLATAGILDLIDRGEGRKALAVYERAAGDADKQGATDTALLTHGAAAFLAVRFGMPQKAIVHGTRVLELAKDASASPVVSHMRASVYSALGAAYRNAGDRVEARRVLEEGVAFARTVPARRVGLGVLSIGLAHVALQQGDHAAALNSATEAFNLSEQALADLGPRAPDRRKTSLRRHAAHALVIIGRVHLARGDVQQADAAMLQAKTHAALAGLTDIEAEIATVTGKAAYERGDYAKALELFTDGIAVARKINRLPLLLNLLPAVARTYNALNCPDEALAAAREAIKLIEDIRNELSDTGLRSDYLDEKQSVYQMAVHLALRLGKVDEAFALAEAGRSRAFLDLLGNRATLSKGATHALVDEEMRLHGQIAEAHAAAQDTGEEGESPHARGIVARLDVRKLFTLDLHAHLIVLSACETGLGKLSRGDELVGLQRAFLYAGTPAVVTTLWKVDDRATFDLMRAFYERLAADGATTALRRAQLATMASYPHPFAWAAFELTGLP